MIPITSEAQFFQILVDCRNTGNSQMFFFCSPWDDSNAKLLAKQLEVATVDEPVYSVNIFDFPSLSEEFKLRRLPSLVIYYGDSRQYRVYDIPHLIRRSFVPAKVRKLAL